MNVINLIITKNIMQNVLFYHVDIQFTYRSWTFQFKQRLAYFRFFGLAIIYLKFSEFCFHSEFCSFSCHLSRVSSHLIFEVYQFWKNRLQWICAMICDKPWAMRHLSLLCQGATKKRLEFYREFAIFKKVVALIYAYILRQFSVRTVNGFKLNLFEVLVAMR